MTCILIDMEKLRVVKRAPTVNQLEYHAELLCKNRDFRIQGPENRHWSAFTITELAQIYMNANGPSGAMRSYEDAVLAVAAVVAKLPIDETSAKDLAKKLGYEIKTAETQLPRSGYAVDMQAPPGVVGNGVAEDEPAPAKGKRGKKQTVNEELNTAAAMDAAGKKTKVKAEKPAKEAKPPREKADASGRPPSTSKTGQVWDIADKILKASPKADKGNKEFRTKVIDACVKAGINQSTAGVQFSKWKSA